MMDRNDGGPAFPTWVESEDGSVPIHGMTLRDYLAAKAMQGLIAGAGDFYGSVDYDADMVVRSAYALADAMLKERAK